MSSGKAHLVSGVLLVVAAIAALVYYGYVDFKKNAGDMLWGLVFTGVYAMLPDIDIPQSSISKLVRQTLLMTVLILGLYYHFRGDARAGIIALLSLVILIVLSVSSHRTWVHTPWTGLVLAAPLAYFNWIWAVMAFGGWMTHLLLDGETK